MEHIDKPCFTDLFSERREKTFAQQRSAKRVFSVARPRGYCLPQSRGDSSVPPALRAGWTQEHSSRQSHLQLFPSKEQAVFPCRRGLHVENRPLRRQHQNWRIPLALKAGLPGIGLQATGHRSQGAEEEWESISCRLLSGPRSPSSVD